MISYHTQKTNRVGDLLVQVLACLLFVAELFSVNGTTAMTAFILSCLKGFLTAPLMDLRIPLSALKCITINVIWYTCRMVCLLWRQTWHRDKRWDRNRVWLDTRELLNVSVSSESIFGKYHYSGEVAYRRMPSDSPIADSASVMQLMDGYRTQRLTDFKGVKGVIRYINTD